MVLRNVVPRQGTETEEADPEDVLSAIEKCSSPTGDGNSDSGIFKRFKEFLIEKCSSPTGDGNFYSE